MNNISFTGINNLYVGKKSQSGYGVYMTRDGRFKEGEKEKLDVLIKCDLTDDEKGNHLSDFQRAAKKVGAYTRLNYVDSKEPQHVEILASHQNAKDDITSLAFSTFKINGVEVPLSDRKILPLYTYMAKLTKEISGSDEFTKAQKNYADKVNKFVSDEATYYIDYMM